MPIDTIFPLIADAGVDFLLSAMNVRPETVFCHMEIVWGPEERFQWNLVVMQAGLRCVRSSIG